MGDARRGIRAGRIGAARRIAGRRIPGRRRGLAACATPVAARVGRRIWADPLAWIVSIYMGSQSASYYILATWIAPYSASLDRSAVLAGIDTMIFQLLGVAGSMLLPFVIRGRAQPWGPALVAGVSLIASIGYLALPALLPAWLVLGGLSAGASLTIALMLTATRARTAQHAAALSGMAQSVGYLIAAAGPIVFGWLLGLGGGSSGAWIAPFALVWLVTAVQIVFGLAVRKPRFVLEPRPER
ncbi:MFS transporter [Leucobacter soli]|uniref:hypothetical protein n=1 Tax=Leucobacter soli TaxID=2812850 RepID=UPI00361413AE